MKKKILIILVIVIVLVISLIVIKRKRDVDSALRQVEQQNIEKAKEVTKLEQEQGVVSKKDSKIEIDKVLVNKEYKEIDEYVKTLKTIREVKLALPKINSYSTVQNARVEGTYLFVNFKEMGTVSWGLWNAPGVN